MFLVKVDTDNEFGSFKVDVTNGKLAPKDKKLIKVLFIPQYPIIYYKKLTLLIQNHVRILKILI